MLNKIQDFIRRIKWKIQKQKRGWSDREIWNLDDTIVKWIVPRLKAYKDTTQGYPGNLDSYELWQSMLDEMIFGFEFDESNWYSEHVFGLKGEEKEKKLKEFESLRERAEKGRIIFAKCFNNLWW